jgi:hypothetical protein
MVLGHPDAIVAPVFRMDSEIAGIMERAARIGLFCHPDQF